MRVGNGQFARNQTKPKAVHPHACGERVTLSCCLRSSAGSSPCVWGTVPRSMVVRLLRLVHPHACGERLVYWCEGCRRHGSSPCVWGTDTFERQSTSKKRFIPMRVGNGLILLYCFRKEKNNSNNLPIILLKLSTLLKSIFHLLR